MKNNPNLILNELTPEEKRVILHKGTEMPFSGTYNNHKLNGAYLCRQCNSPLYESKHKFESGCGWPSFEEEIPGMVLRLPDADGRRIEIVCATCQGHLGHVFYGEQFTFKNSRHCVNSISLKFTPQLYNHQYHRIVLAGGCFWGKQYFWQQQLGIISTIVGFTGGHLPFPTSIQVANNLSGHTEAVQITYNPEIVTTKALLQTYFEHYQFTHPHGLKSYYRSGIFYYTPSQAETAQQLKQQLILKGYQIDTVIEPIANFYPAEDKHQNYYQRQGKDPENMPKRTILFPENEVAL